MHCVDGTIAIRFHSDLLDFTTYSLQLQNKYKAIYVNKISIYTTSKREGTHTITNIFLPTSPL